MSLIGQDHAGWCGKENTRLQRAASFLTCPQAQEGHRVETHLKTLLLLGSTVGREAHVFPQVANACGKLATWFNEFKLDVKVWH